MTKIILFFTKIFFILFLVLNLSSNLYASTYEVTDIDISNMSYIVTSSSLDHNSLFSTNYGEFVDNINNWKKISEIDYTDFERDEDKGVKKLVLKFEFNSEIKSNTLAILLKSSFSSFNIYNSNGKIFTHTMTKRTTFVDDNEKLFLSVNRDYNLFLIPLSDAKHNNNEVVVYLVTEFDTKDNLGKIEKVQFGELDSLTKLIILNSGSLYNDSMTVFFIIFSSLFFLIFYKMNTKDKTIKKVYLYFALLLLSIGIDFLFNNLCFSYTVDNFMNGFPDFLRVLNRFLLPIWFTLFLLALYSSEKNKKGNKILKIAIWHLVVIIIYYLIDRHIVQLYAVNIYGIYNIFEITIIAYFFYLYFFKKSIVINNNNLFLNSAIGMFFILIVLDFILISTPLALSFHVNYNLASYGFFFLSSGFIYTLFEYLRKTELSKGTIDGDVFDKSSDNSKRNNELKRLRTQIIDSKNHLNPTFMTNTFEKMSGLIAKDNFEAIDFSKELFGVYKYLLNNQGKELSTIKDELKFIESYYYLYSRCFEGDLFLRIDIDEKYFLKRIPMLTLQLLFEHAVKYNTISSENNLTIVISIEELDEGKNSSLLVMYDLKQRNRFKISSGIALTNLRERVSFFTDEKVKIIDDENSLTIKLPLI